VDQDTVTGMMMAMVTISHKTATINTKTTTTIKTMTITLPQITTEPIIKTTNTTTISITNMIHKKKQALADNRHLADFQVKSNLQKTKKVLVELKIGMIR
tara:strand:- start:1479 stop:1778 length:300 start_codon:yes stop_codon:yes gene_type:complete